MNWIFRTYLESVAVSFPKSFPAQTRLLFFCVILAARASVKWRQYGAREFTQFLLAPPCLEIISSWPSEPGPGVRDAAIKSTTNCFRAACRPLRTSPQWNYPRASTSLPSFPSALFRNSGCNLLYVGRSLFRLNAAKGPRKDTALFILELYLRR